MADVLIVDDDFETREVLRAILLSLGHTARVAVDGERGLSSLDDGLPDLILLDMEMPVLDGADMAYRMFVHNAGQEEIPIVLISGIAELRARASQVGTPYFLGKPFKFERLVDMLNRALSERIPPVPAVALGGARP